MSGPQVHVLYVVASDGADRGLDTNGGIASSVAAFERWFADQTDGRWLRVDTFEGAADVTFVRIGATDAEIAAGTPIVGALTSAGFTRPSKVYLAYYDGTSSGACAGTTLSAEITLSVLYLANGPPRCRWTPPPPGWPADPRAEVPDATLVDYTAAHETLHMLGFVPDCAPHHTGNAHVDDDRNDLMTGRYLDPIVLDRAHDDYFEANLANCADLSASPFLVRATMYPVAVKVVGGGRVRLTGGTHVATCAETCTESFPRFTTVRFASVSEAGYELEGWDGDCSGGGGCAVYVDGPKSVSVEFVRERFLVRVTVSGKGRVSGGGLACPPRCTASLTSDVRVRLVAKPARGWHFVRWRGNCSGAGACVLHLSAPAAVRAQFTRSR